MCLFTKKIKIKKLHGARGRRAISSVHNRRFFVQCHSHHPKQVLLKPNNADTGLPHALQDANVRIVRSPLYSTLSILLTS